MKEDILKDFVATETGRSDLWCLITLILILQLKKKHTGWLSNS